MNDYIPRPDNDFLPWAQNFRAVASANAAALGLLAPDTAALDAQCLEYNSSIAGLMAARAATLTALGRKDTARHTLEENIRAKARMIQARPGVSNELKASLGLTVRDTTRTFGAAVVSGRAAGWVDTSERLRHTIHFHEQDATSKAKPRGIKGCEIWVKIGAPPQSLEGSSGNPSDMQFLSLDSATPYVASFQSADGGKTAYYLLRWIANDGTPGAWSETLEATIVA